METGFEFTKRLRAVSDRDVARLRESCVDHAHAFDAEQMDDRLLFPLEMTWFYDEPVYDALSDDRKLMLNRLTFCMSYYSTAVAEAATNVLNYEAALATFLHGDTDVAEYMAREVVEETMHVQAFLCLIRKVVAHYGLTLEQLRGANVSLPMASWYVRAHTLVGWLRGDLNFYYFTRYALNVNQKTVERCSINEPNMHPLVRKILKNHAIDEARHMQMSRGTGLVALSRMRTSVARTAACLGYAGFAANIFIGRHLKDSRLTRKARMRTLELCGVPHERAVEAYRQWHERTNQPQDPPLVRAGRAYYLRCNNGYIDDLPVASWVKTRMKRIIAQGYSDVAQGDTTAVNPLEFDELKRAS
jgi:hypothetical protein